MPVIVDELMENGPTSRTGCFALAIGGLLILGLVVFFAAYLTIAIVRDRTAAQYPGSTEITSHTNYSGLPRQIRWDNSYYTTDNFTEVYNWYSTRFNLGAESRAMSRCILLEGPGDALFWQRYYTIMICNTDDGQLIYVTRSTILRSPLS